MDSFEYFIHLIRHVDGLSLDSKNLNDRIKDIMEQMIIDSESDFDDFIQQLVGAQLPEDILEVMKRCIDQTLSECDFPIETFEEKVFLYIRKQKHTLSKEIEFYRDHLDLYFDMIMRYDEFNQPNVKNDFDKFIGNYLNLFTNTKYFVKFVNYFEQKLIQNFDENDIILFFKNLEFNNNFAGKTYKNPAFHLLTDKKYFVENKEIRSIIRDKVVQLLKTDTGNNVLFPSTRYLVDFLMHFDPKEDMDVCLTHFFKLYLNQKKLLSVDVSIAQHFGFDISYSSYANDIEDDRISKVLGACFTQEQLQQMSLSSALLSDSSAMLYDLVRNTRVSTIAVKNIKMDITL